MTLRLFFQALSLSSLSLLTRKKTPSSVSFFPNVILMNIVIITIIVTMKNEGLEEEEEAAAANVYSEETA